jgi:transcription elongation factor Elf1
MRKKKTILRNLLGSSIAQGRKGAEHYFSCPFCNHHKKKLAVNIDKNVFHCWVCDTKGGISYLVKRFGSIDDRHDWALLEQEVDLSTIDSIFNQPEEKPKPVKLPAEYICLAKKGLPPAAKEQDWILLDR